MLSVPSGFLQELYSQLVQNENLTVHTWLGQKMIGYPIGY